MSNESLRLAVIIGSVREGRFGPVPATWFVGEAREHGRFDVTTVDLVEVPLPLTLPAVPPAMARDYPRPAELTKVTRTLEAADAFVVVTPEHNHSFPASVKCLVDWHFTQWQAKPVGFVSYGGVAGGLRAVEQLRQVFAELHAVTVRDSVSFPKYWERFGGDGRPVQAKEAADAARAMLDQLAWWGDALREARRRRPYQDVIA